MSKRLQLVVSEAEHGEIRDAADRNRTTISAWVRRALREVRARELRGWDSGAGRSGGSPWPAVVREAGPQGSGLSAAERPPVGDEPGVARRIQVELVVTGELLEAIRRRHGFADWSTAAEYALRRAAVVPMTKAEALEMQGEGWDGDLEAARFGFSETGE